jgi:hypothetical protein
VCQDCAFALFIKLTLTYQKKNIFICFTIIYVQLDPENVEALVALAIMDLHTNEGELCQQILFSL